MSNTVDNRVVEMTFDNQQFEAGVRQTIASLDALKDALKFNASATNLSTLQNAVNGFSLSNIESAVESLQYRFSTMGIVGMNVISDLTQAAIGLAMKIERISIGQIISGGKARAQKVADARFQLEGLLKDADKVQSAFDSASKAVDGTAYGLDAAVSTASQLAASNVALGDDLDTALRGVAGLAAMTNSSFEEMGNIFATVAGNGRLMGMQLTQISSKGTNVAAVLANEMGKTEEEIRKMVSRGEISFSQFAEAMNNAFGDQAQKANETLTGSLNNVKAALSRIGEIFYSGIIENKDFIKVVNDLRVAINAVKKAMEPLKKPFATLISSASKLGSAVLALFNVKGLDELVAKVADGMNVLSGWLFKAAKFLDKFKEATGLDKVVAKVEKTNEKLETLSEEQKKIIENILFGPNDYGNGETRKERLDKDYQMYQDYINAMYKAGFDWSKADEIYSNMVIENANKVTDAKKDEAEAEEELYSATKPSFQAIGNIADIINGIKTQVESFQRVVQRVKTAFKNVFSYRDVSRDVTRLVKVFKSLTERFEITEERAEKIQHIFEGLFSVIDILRQLFVTFVQVMEGTVGPILSKVFDIFLSVGSYIGSAIKEFNDFIKTNETIYNIGKKVVDIFTKISTTLGEFFRRFKELPAVQKLKDHFVDFVSGIGKDLLDFFGKAEGAVGDFFNSISDSDAGVMDRVLGGINTALEKMMELSGKAKDKITNVFDWFGKKKDQAEEAGISIDKISTNFEKVKKLGKKLAKSKGPSEFIGNLIDGFTDINGHIADFVKSLGDIFANIDFAKLGLIGFTGALTAFTASLSYFTFYAGEFMKTLSMFKEIPDMFKEAKNLFKGIKDYLMAESKAKVLKAMALAIVALAGSLVALTFVDQDKLKTATTCLAILMGLMTIMVEVISRTEKSAEDLTGFNKKLRSFAVLMISMSIGVLLLAQALKTLSDIKWDRNTAKAIAVLVGLMAALVGVSFAMSKGALLDYFKSGSLSLIAYAAAVWILVKALNKLTNLDVDKLEGKLGVVIKCLIAVGLVSLMASKLKLRSVLGVILLIGSIFLIELALKKIIESGVKTEDILNNLNRLVPVIIALGLLALYITALGKAGEQAKGAVAVILATTIAIIAITYALRKLAILSMTGHLMNAVSALAIIFLGMIALVGVIGAAEFEFSHVGGTLIKMAVAIGIITLAVRALGKMEESELKQGLAAARLLVLMMLVLAVATVYASQIDGSSFVKMAGVIAVLALITALLSYVHNEQGQLTSAALILGGVLLAFGEAMNLATQHVNKSSPKALIAMIAAVAVIAAALIGILQYTGSSNAELLKTVAAATALSLVLLAFGRVIEIMHNITASMTANRLKAMAQMIDAMKVLVAAVAVIGLSLTGILYVAKSAGQIVAAGLALAGVLAAMMLCLNILKDAKVGPEIGAGFLLGCFAVLEIAAALALILNSTTDFEAMEKAAIILVGVLGAMMIVLSVLGGISSTGIGAAGILAASGALAIGLAAISVTMLALAHVAPILVKALEDLCKVPFDKLKAHLGTLLKLGLIANVFALTLPMVAVGLLGISAAILVVAVAVDSIILSVGIALSMLTKTILALTSFTLSVNSLLKTLKNLTKNDKQFVTGLDNISNSIGRFIINIIESIAKGMVRFAVTIGNNAFIIGAAFEKIVTVILAVIGKAIMNITKLIFDGMDAFFGMLVKRLPKTLVTIGKVLVIIGNFLIKMGDYLGYVGGMLTVKLLLGVLEALEGYADLIVDRVYSLGVSLMFAVGDALYNNADLVRNAFQSIILGAVFSVLTIVDGLLDGALSKSEKFTTLMSAISDEMVEKEMERNKLLVEKQAREQQRAMEEEAAGLKKTRELTLDKIFGGGEEQAEKAGYDEGHIYLSSFKRAINEGETDLIKDVSDIPDSVVKAMTDSGNYTLVKDKFGEYLVSTMADGVGENQEELTREVEKLPNTVITEAIESGRWTMSEDGKYLVNTLLTAFNSKETISDGESALEDQQDNWLDKIKSYGTKWREAGGSLGDDLLGGMGDSIDSGSGEIESKIEDLVDKYINNTFEEGEEIDSPSKVFYRYGAYLIQGLINGIDAMTKPLTRTTEDTSEVLNTSMADSLNSIRAMMEMDLNGEYTPTIKPVLDMSNVQNGSNLLGTFMDNTKSVQLAANSQLSIDNANQFRLADQIEALRTDINKLANTDFEHMMDGVNINVNAETTVDGQVLRKTSSDYTIGQINRRQMGYAMATGGKF